MSRKPPTPEELFRRMIEPFEDEESPEEFELRLDRELERTLAMTPAEIRADLAAMGYDVAAIERDAREFLGRMGWRPPLRRIQGRLLSVAAPLLVLTSLAGAAPSLIETLPLAARAASEPPAVTAAAPPTFTDSADGGSDDARSR